MKVDRSLGEVPDYDWEPETYDIHITLEQADYIMKCVTSNIDLALRWGPTHEGWIKMLRDLQREVGYVLDER